MLKFINRVKIRFLRYFYVGKQANNYYVVNNNTIDNIWHNYYGGLFIKKKALTFTVRTLFCYEKNLIGSSLSLNDK